MTSLPNFAIEAIGQKSSVSTSYLKIWFSSLLSELFVLTGTYLGHTEIAIEYLGFSVVYELTHLNVETEPI